MKQVAIVSTASPRLDVEQKLVKNQLFLFPEWELNHPDQGHNNRLDNIVRTDTKLSVRNSKKTPKNYGR